MTPCSYCRLVTGSPIPYEMDSQVWLYCSALCIHRATKIPATEEKIWWAITHNPTSSMGREFPPRIEYIY